MGLEMCSGQPSENCTRLTREEIISAAHGPYLSEVMKHFGYQEIGQWSNTWINKPGEIENLATLPEFIKTLDLDKCYRIIFDYDPNYPRMLLQATVRVSSQ